MRLLIAAPILLLLVLFTLSNRTTVSLGLWPTGLHLQAPLSIVVLAAAAVAFLAGGLIVWVNEIGQRRRARRAEASVRKLEEQVQILRARLAAPLPPAAPPPAAGIAPAGVTPPGVHPAGMLPSGLLPPGAPPATPPSPALASAR